MVFEKAEREFLEYDWSASNLWQQYYNNLYPTPSSSQLVVFKRKWFKKNVNSELEIYPKEQYSNFAQNNKNDSNFSNYKNASEQILIQSKGYKMWMVLSLSFSLLLSLLIPIISFVPVLNRSALFHRLVQLCTTMYIVGLGINLYEISVKPIKFLSTEFWQKILTEDSFHSFISLLAFFGLTYSFPMIFIIPAITSIFILSNYQPLFQDDRIVYLFQIVKKNRNHLYQRRAYFEVIALGIYVIFSTITGRISIIYISLYWCLMKIKYPIDPYIQYTFRAVDSNINAFLTSYSNYIPHFLPKIYKWVSFNYVKETIHDIFRFLNFSEVKLVCRINK
ncbi:family UPF0121 protein [Cryptosporidium felis]|nr:family UPF0121 protein [Cryptosporidium felis]